MTRLHHLALLSTAALVLVGCSGDGAAEPRSTDTSSVADTATPTPKTRTSADAAPMGDTETCEADRFTVAYPQGWQTNDTDVVPEACRVFHPTGIDLEPGTELGLRWAAVLRVEDVAFDRAIRTSSPGSMLLDQREHTVAGHQAVVTEQRAGERAPLVPSGTRVYRWTVEVDADTSLIASTYDAGTLDYEREKQVLDAMMATLEL